jgi:hypothetical protein
MLQKPTHDIGKFPGEVQKSKIYAWSFNPVLYTKTVGDVR